MEEGAEIQTLFKVGLNLSLQPTQGASLEQNLVQTGHADVGTEVSFISLSTATASSQP